MKRAEGPAPGPCRRFCCAQLVPKARAPAGLRATKYSACAAAAAAATAAAEAAAAGQMSISGRRRRTNFHLRPPPPGGFARNHLPRGRLNPTPTMVAALPALGDDAPPAE